MATYHDDIQAEKNWHKQCGAPGRQPINRTSHSFIAGQQAAYWGQSREDCPHLPDGEAARNWLAGFDDEQKAQFNRERFERNRETSPGKW